MARNDHVNVQLNTQYISSNPSFNFLNIIRNQDIDNTEHSFVAEDASPYDNFDINCTYASIYDCPKNNPDLLTILSFNVQSLSAKFNELKDLIYEMHCNNSSPDIICLQEIWKIPDNTCFSLNGYFPLIFKGRSTAQGGGVGFYIKTGLKFVINEPLSIFHDRIFETLIIEVMDRHDKKHIIGTLYRPGTPLTNYTNSDIINLFSELLSNLLENLSLTNVPVFLFGDLNLDVLKYSQSTTITDYINLMFSYGFIQTISLPTRCTLNSTTLIDHCITNAINCTHSSKIITSNISDHFPIFYSISSFPKTNKNRFIEGRNFSETNLNKFLNNFRSINWTDFYSLNDTQAAFDLFSENFLTLYNLHFPAIKVKFNANYHRGDPWFTNGLLISRREKLRLDKKASSSKNHHDVTKYKNYRNIYNKLLRLAKRTYFDSQLVLNQSNLKKTWQLIRCAINRKPKKTDNPIPCLTIDNFSIHDPIEIANCLNRFFTSAPQLIVDKIPPYPPEPNLINIPIPPKFRSSDLQVSEDEIFKAFNELTSKQSLDFNNISMAFLKKCSNTIINHLKHIINLSFQMGVFPSQCKIAKVVPIFKSGDPRNPNNYRPIALLCNFSKVIEKVMCSRLTNFLECNNLITECQFGFRSNHSTLHPLMHLSNFISKAFNEKKARSSYFL